MLSALRNIPVARKFYYAFGFICLFFVGLGIYTYLTFRAVSTQAVTVAGDDFPSVLYLAEARTAANAMRRADLALLLCSVPSCTTHFIQVRNQALESYQKSIEGYQPFVTSDKERDLYKQFTELFTRYLDISNRAVAMIKAGNAGDALDLLMSESTIEGANQVLVVLGEDTKLNSEEGMQSAQEVVTYSKRAIWINLVMTILIAILCGVVGTTLDMVIAPRIETVTASLERVAGKDLTANVEVNGADEIGRLGLALNTCVDSMRSVLLSVAQGADTLSAATTEISARAVQTAGNAHTQSSKTNQIAAAAQQMTATIGEISHNALSAAEASRISADNATQGGP